MSIPKIVSVSQYDSNIISKIVYHSTVQQHLHTEHTVCSNFCPVLLVSWWPEAVFTTLYKVLYVYYC